YLGGSGVDIPSGLFVTGSEVYVTGMTDSTDFPGTAGGAQATSGGGADTFVARLDLALTTLAQATYLGGSGADGLSSDPQGLGARPSLFVTGSEVFVAGPTSSTDFPGTAGGAQPTNAGDYDAFVARLTPALTNLTQATYLGGSGFDEGSGVSVMGSDVFVAGLTSSADLPGTAGGAQPGFNGPLPDSFV